MSNVDAEKQLEAMVTQTVELAISQKDLNFLIDGTIKTITTLSKKI